MVCKLGANTHSSHIAPNVSQQMKHVTDSQQLVSVLEARTRLESFVPQSYVCLNSTGYFNDNYKLMSQVY